MSYDFTVPKSTTASSIFTMGEQDPEPDSNPVLRFLTESLKRAAESEKETRHALALHQEKTDATMRERQAIERAIKAYQHEPELVKAARNADRVVSDEGWQARHGVDRPIKDQP